jgi:hypothetical protein
MINQTLFTNLEFLIMKMEIFIIVLFANFQSSKDHSSSLILKFTNGTGIMLTINSGALEQIIIT